MGSTRLTPAEVEHIAFLARLALTEEEKSKFAEQFYSILEYFGLLEGVDTSNIPPTAQVTALSDVLAKDEVSPSMSREDFLRSAPETQDGHIKARLILSDES